MSQEPKSSRLNLVMGAWRWIEEGVSSWGVYTGLGLFVATMTVSVGSAATLHTSSLEELTQEADLIVHGRVEEVRLSSSDEDPFSTVVVLAVQEAWKETPSPTVRLRLPRGTHSEITQAVPGLPTFQLGEEVIVFLVREPNREFEVLHGVHGKLKVLIDPQHGTAVVENVSGAKTALTAFLNRLRRLTMSSPQQ